MAEHNEDTNDTRASDPTNTTDETAETLTGEVVLQRKVEPIGDVVLRMMIREAADMLGRSVGLAACRGMIPSDDLDANAQGNGTLEMVVTVEPHTKRVIMELRGEWAMSARPTTLAGPIVIEDRTVAELGAKA